MTKAAVHLVRKPACMRQYYSYSLQMLKIPNLLISLLVSLALSSAFAQSRPSEVLLTSQSGCKLYHPISWAIVEAQLLNVAGDCVNGFFSGAVIYGVSWSLNITDRPNKIVIGTHIGIMEQGRFTGFRMALNELNNVALIKADRSNGYSAQKGFAGYSLAQLVDAINIEALNATGANASASRDHLINIATTWDRNPAGFLSAYTQDTSNPRVSISNSVPTTARQPSNSNDDPKVFGRSARGG